MTRNPNITYPSPASTKMVAKEQDIDFGFIWHTTGSGKTLTLFKVSTLLKENLGGSTKSAVSSKAGVDNYRYVEANEILAKLTLAGHLR